MVVGEITFDGHWLYCEVDDDGKHHIIDMAADVANFCREKNIELVPRGAEVRDNKDGTITVRYRIRSM